MIEAWKPRFLHKPRLFHFHIVTFHWRDSLFASPVRQVLGAKKLTLLQKLFRQILDLHKWHLMPIK